MKKFCVINVALALCAMLAAASGCMDKATELERFSDSVMGTVIAPAIEKAIAETSTRTAALSGGAQAIEPGYEVHARGMIGTGFDGTVTVKVIGVSGQVDGHIQTDAGQAGSVDPPGYKSPAKTEEPSGHPDASKHDPPG